MKSGIQDAHRKIRDLVTDFFVYTCTVTICSW